MRKGQATKRKILADPIYGSTTIAKAINMLMYDGKKGLAQDTFYTALSAAAKKLNQEPLDVFNKALENIGPAIELKVRRVAGSNYQVPTEVAPERKVTLALRWLITYTRVRNEKTIVGQLTGELVDAYNGTGAAVKKRDDTHKMAEANKAYAHLRF